MMKNVIRLLIAIAMLFSVAAMGQADKTAKTTEKAQQTEAKTAMKGKSMSLTGWIKTDNDKTVFTNDKDKQDWTVQNADMAKPHDGKHVKIKAALHEGDQSLTIEKINDLREGKQSKQTQDAEKKK